MKPPAQLMANYENDQLIVLFESEPKEPLKLNGKIDFGVYDPTFYTAIDFTEDDNMAVDDSCRPTARAQVIRPDPDEAIAQNQSTLTDAFFNDPTGTDLSKIFATRLELDCKPRDDAVSKTAIRIVFALLAVAYVASHFLTHAHAQSSLGIGTNEATLPSTGLFAALDELDQRPAAGILPRADRRAEGDAHGRQQAVAAGRPVLRLRHLPRRRPRPRQGGDLLLHAGQRGGAAPRHPAVLRLGLPAGVHGDRRDDAGVPGAARHRDLDDRRDLVPRSGELRADHRLSAPGCCGRRPGRCCVGLFAGKPAHSLSAAHAHSHGACAQPPHAHSHAHSHRAQP